MLMQQEEPGLVGDKCPQRDLCSLEANAPKKLHGRACDGRQHDDVSSSSSKLRSQQILLQRRWCGGISNNRLRFLVGYGPRR